MKKFIAILLTALLVVTMIMPAAAVWEEAANLMNINFTIKRAYQTPVIDGSFDGDLAWGDPLPVTAADRTIIWPEGDDAAYARAKGEDWKIWMVYDDAYLYMLARASSEGFDNTYEGEDGNIWQASAMQLGFGPVGIADDQYLEVGIGANGDTGGLTYVVWFNNSPDKAGEWTADELKANSAVRIDGADVWYETKVPFASFLPKTTVSQGDQFTTGAVVLIRMPNLDGGTVGSHLAWGIFGERKGAERFAKITLGDQIQPPAEVPTEAPAEAPAAAVPEPAAPAPTAPKTGDAAAVWLTVMILAAAAFVFVKKRVSVK